MHDGGLLLRVTVETPQRLTDNVPVGVGTVEGTMLTPSDEITVVRFLKVKLPVPHVDDHVTEHEYNVPEAEDELIVPLVICQFLWV